VEGAVTQCMVHGHSCSQTQSDARNAHDRHPSMRASASDYSAKAARKPRPEGQNCTRRHAPSMPPYVQLVQFASFMHQTRQSLVDLLLAHTRSTRNAHTNGTIMRYDCAGNLWHGGCGQRERGRAEAGQPTLCKRHCHSVQSKCETMQCMHGACHWLSVKCSGCVCAFSLGVHFETHSPCCALTYSRGDTTVSECAKVVSNKCIAITPRARAPHCVCIFARAISFLPFHTVDTAQCGAAFSPTVTNHSQLTATGDTTPTSFSPLVRCTNRRVRRFFARYFIVIAAVAGAESCLACDT
jgi:hypothetical protein